ncbi:hypothetical protein BC831DRAFT_543634, partial [Entophlyctis helioformis]
KLGVPKVRGKPPVAALSPDIRPGSCWALAGSRGMLGINLAASIIPTDITVEHLPKELWIGRQKESAPRHIELWAVLDASRFKTQLLERLDEPAVRQTSTTTEAATTGKQSGKQSGKQPAQTAPAGVLLGEYEFDPQRESLRVFPVQRLMGTKVHAVAVRVRSNWGNAAWTCCRGPRQRHGCRWDVGGSRSCGGCARAMHSEPS